MDETRTIHAMAQVAQRSEGFPGQRLVVVPSAVIRRVGRLPVTRDLAVTHLGHFVTAPGHFVRRSAGAAQWVMIYCLEGAGVAGFRKSRLQLGSGDLVLLPPGQPHSYEASAANPWSIFWVHFTGQRAKDHADALGWSGESPVLHVPDGAMMMSAFEDIYRHTLHGMSDSEMLALGTSFARLLGLARLGCRARGTRARQTEDRILEVVSMLRKQPQRAWTVRGMAEDAGMSPGYFSDLFRLQTGSPPMTFLIRLRLQMACRILEQEQESIEIAANRVGYDDAYYFSRLFRRHLGVAPSRFRREARAGR